MKENKIISYANAPAFLTSGIVCLPNNLIRFEISANEALNQLQHITENQDGYVILLIEKSSLDNKSDQKEYYEHAVLGRIIRKIKTPTGSYRIRVEGLDRVVVKGIRSEGNLLNVDYEVLHSFVENESESKVIIKSIFKNIEKHSEFFNSGSMITNRVSEGMDIIELSDIFAFEIKSDFNDKIKYLTELNVNSRLKMILEDLNKESYYKELEATIEISTRKNIEESQKEYYLREKIKTIQDELGDRGRREADFEAYREKIEAKNMPNNFKEKALDELRKLEITPTSSAENATIRQYLDFILSLPYNEETKDKNDLKEAKKILDKGHYGLEKIKERILEFLAVKMSTSKNPQTILCLVGPPGVGKTSLAKGIAESLGKNFVRLALGGVRDVAEIRGHRRTYIGALPGRILTQMKTAEVNNPLFLIDEIDKLGSDYKGDPSDAMLEVLDPEQNHSFMDHFVEEPYDLSKVMFIATANYLGDIPEALRDRMEIIQLSSYTEIEKLNIAIDHLIARQLNIHGLTKKQFKIKEEAIALMINNYTREAGVRQLDRLFGKLCRKTVRKIYEGDAKSVTITEKNLEEYLGKALFVDSSLDKEAAVGIVNGLAYTTYGGATLQIEGTYYTGKGNLIITGNLGDVMQESAKIALSLVKSKAEEYSIDPEVFKNDIHIHVPEGATPKDGPSAGVTMTTALVSALSGKKVKSSVGMTGEITLRGKVLPIGGLREKSIAAHRQGLDTIFIPYENIRDIDDIPEIVKNNLKIIPVKYIDEILSNVLVK